jgi:hypothetical protein
MGFSNAILMHHSHSLHIINIHEGEAFGVYQAYKYQESLS